ncbi:MAG TPA: TonB-dependent receptor [Flavisolibacter sp.]|nr:TonB-dependent receptor [Flavisolibacter sp.]
MRIALFFTAFLLVFFPALAQQQGKIQGTVSQNGKAAENATVSLLRAKDSSVIKLSVSNKNGQFLFDDVQVGNYLVSVTAVGHQKAVSKPIEITPQQQNVHLAEIVLSPLVKDMASVTVTAKRPLIEQRIDRTVVNVDASITNVGTSALEVLEKSPGVSVDRDGNISLKGKEGVLVMIDGRPTQLGGADLANLLRNLNSNQLDQIEIMTNPPARFDAAGASGVINIKTKKAIKSGFNGSVNIAYSQGRYPKTTEGFNFNYGAGKVNLFANLGHNYQQRFSILKMDRNIFANGTNTVDKIFNQESNRVGKGNSYSAKFGIDFFATKKTTVGAVINLNERDMSSSNPNITRISNAAKNLESITKALVDNETDWSSSSANVNFRTLLDKKGKELTADIDYAKHTMQNDLFMVNSYTNANGSAYRKADTLTGLLPQTINVYSARVDYLHPLKNGARLEAGVKSSIVKTDNNARYDSIQNGIVVHDYNRSNHFIYEENINAAYVNLSTPLSKRITAQLGLRLENTNANGVQKTTSEDFDRNYTQLFPTAFFQYKANEKNVFGANFGRRVSRPSYQSLNPFIRFIDRYTFSQGNPQLKPSVSNNIELSHSWKSQITTTINYTYIKDIIQEVIQQKGQEAYNMPANVSSLHQVGLSVNANTPFTKWWTSSINVNLYNDRYKGQIDEVSIDRSATSIIINATQQFKVTKGLTAELNGRFRNGWLEGIMRTRSVGFIGAGLSQQILKNKGTIRLTARDIFWTQKFKGTTRYGNVDVVLNQIAETQVVTLGFSYSFSKGKKIAPVKRTAGSANEEQNRIGQ